MYVQGVVLGDGGAGGGTTCFPCSGIGCGEDRGAQCCRVVGGHGPAAGGLPPGKVESVEVEHPTGFFTVYMDVEMVDNRPVVKRAALLRTARKLMSGEVYVPATVWDGK